MEGRRFLDNSFKFATLLIPPPHKFLPHKKMYQFNKQERLFLLSLCCVLFAGSALQYIVKAYPNINDIINVIESESFYPKININRANKETLVRIPYIGEYTAEQIIEYRMRKGKFSSLDELKTIKGIREKNFKRFSPYLKIK